MSNWKFIWNNRKINDFNNTNSILGHLIEADGFDSPTGKINESDWVNYLEYLKKYIKINNEISLFEIGMGSGAFLYPFYLSKNKVGALIVVQRETGLRIYKETGTQIKGEVTSGLLLSIFNPGSPLHDGAVILQNTLVEAAGCILPLTESEMITPDMGTRHRAALGLTEETDAIVIVISEERGAIATAENGRFVKLDMDEMSLRRYLNERLFISSGD